MLTLTRDDLDARTCARVLLWESQGPSHVYITIDWPLNLPDALYFSRQGTLKERLRKRSGLC